MPFWRKRDGRRAVLLRMEQRLADLEQVVRRQQVIRSTVVMGPTTFDGQPVAGQVDTGAGTSAT